MIALTLNAAGMTTTLAEDGVHGVETHEAMDPPDAIISDTNNRNSASFSNTSRVS